MTEMLINGVNWNKPVAYTCRGMDPKTGRIRYTKVWAHRIYAQRRCDQLVHENPGWDFRVVCAFGWFPDSFIYEAGK